MDVGMRQGPVGARLHERADHRLDDMDGIGRIEAGIDQVS
jgi:hypothetical protein